MAVYVHKRLQRLSVSLFVLLLTVSAFRAHALTQGNYTYDVTNGTATITGFNRDFVGALNIADTLGRYPVTRIAYAFQAAGGIASATIPGSVCDLGGYAFYGCTSMSSVVIGTGIRDIGTHTFSMCQSLTSVMIPDSVTNIGDCAFESCTSLARVTIPASVIYIGDDAFHDNNNLSAVYFCGNAPSLGATVFSGSTNVVVYRLAGATGWPAVPKKFGNRTTALWVHPPVTTGAPTNITPSAATLTGTVNPEGFTTSVQFEYGLTTNYGNTANVALVPDNGTNRQSVGATLTGLQPITRYHYRLAITNAQGTAFGDDATLTTEVEGLNYWEHKYYSTDAVPWDTTSSIRDMDAEAALGAVLIKYPGGIYVSAEYHQYGSTCGPSSLTMVLKALGYTKPSVMVSVPVDVDELPGSGGETCSANFFGSMEHIMWLGYHNHRRWDESWNWDDTRFMSTDGILNTNWLSTKSCWAWWWYGGAVGWGAENNNFQGLIGVMNYCFANRYGLGCRDALPYATHSYDDAWVTAFKRMVKGFVDHGIPNVLAIESGGHFNVLMGYRGDPENSLEPFYIYTADPLDGWGRGAATQPGTWRRIQVTQQSMKNGSGLIVSYACWNQHLNGGCDTNGWATEVDRLNGTELLTGRPVPQTDIRGDAISQPEINLSSIDVSFNCPSLRWESTRGDLAYTVESCSSLSASTWLPCAPTSQWPVTTNQWQGTVLGGSTQHFYRVVVKDAIPVAP